MSWHEIMAALSDPGSVLNGNVDELNRLIGPQLAETSKADLKEAAAFAGLHAGCWSTVRKLILAELERRERASNGGLGT